LKGGEIINELLSVREVLAVLTPLAAMSAVYLAAYYPVVRA